MKNKQVNSFFFLGIGGIGMSALARYYHAKGFVVYGYDRTPSPITDDIQKEGIEVFFDDRVEAVPSKILDEKENTKVIYTPAIPKNSVLLNYVIDNGFNVKKRAQVLGEISVTKNTFAVAGTHGKTSTSTILAWIMSRSAVQCTAFLGGISKNLNSNLILSPQSDYMVAEADEFDRSFLNLFPDSAIITSMDADHLDIYGDHKQVIQSFNEFADRLPNGGHLLINKKIESLVRVSDTVHKKSYSLDQEADYFARNIESEMGFYHFDFVGPGISIKNIHTGYPGLMNVENAVAALAILHMNGIDIQSAANALKDFTGVKRRFDIIINTPERAYIDDYAHHPEELNALIKSVKSMYPGKKITGVFQPHLYTRTRDFADQFAENLSKLDTVLLLPIYPAREEPIEGVSSGIILKNITTDVKELVQKEELLQRIEALNPEVLITIGAGDIDRFTDKIKKLLSEM